MPDRDTVAALSSYLNCDSVSEEVKDALLELQRKEKEKQVLQVHKFKISGPIVTKKQTIYSTRCPWVPSKRVNRSSYNDIIDYLYEYYFASANDRITAREAYDRMMQEYDKDHIVSSLTLAHYRADWNKYVVGKQAKWLDKPISGIHNDQIYEYYRMLTAEGKMKRSTFSNVKTVVNAVFDWAISNDITCIKTSLISTNRLKFAAKTDKWEDVFSSEDRKKILKVCEQIKPTVYSKAVELMFCLDIRIGELRALQKNDVDLSDKTIYIGHQMVDKQTAKANRHSVRVNIMKGGREAGKRTEPLSDRAVAVIKWLYEYNSSSIWLLPNGMGSEPIYTNRFNENLRKICERAGVKYFSSHGIRFHIISAMYDAGIPEKEIQRLSGHTTPAMTRQYNRQISDADADDQIRSVLG